MSALLLPALGRLFDLAAAPAGQVVTPTVPLPTATTILAGSPTAVTSPAAAATVTAAPLPTIPPAPRPTPPGPFSVDYFTATAQPGLGLFSGLFLLLSAVLLAGGAAVYFAYRNRWRRTNRF